MNIEKVEIAVQTACEEVELPSVETITVWVNAALDNARYRPEKQVQITVRIVDEPEGKRLNETWRHRQGPTNVLSFPFDDSPGDAPLLGDIVICAPVAAREAREQHKPATAHWAHLVVHGSLHLLGYEHEGEKQTAAMEALEVYTLQQLGYPNPY
ncbi:MAG: rRNA maturation RNase YbeY [Gammaproteobacteria bacterium]|nr:rRNA maturation RNase YbeY [Gammaproteobacteria bacterium]